MARSRGVVDSATLSTTTGKGDKSKIKLVFTSPDGHRTEMATSRPLTPAMIEDAERLVHHLTTGRRQATCVVCGDSGYMPLDKPPGIWPCECPLGADRPKPTTEEKKEPKSDEARPDFYIDGNGEYVYR